METVEEKKFPAEEFDKSCLIYTKNDYGIFLVTGKDGQNYTIKVYLYLHQFNEEIITARYIKNKIKSFPNLLLPEDVYVGKSPVLYPLFNDEKNRLKLKECKSMNLWNIFHENHTFSYYVTKACLYNLGYYLGVHKGVLTYKAFVSFSFQILTALQALHAIGVWHRDIKPQNILICNSEIAKEYNGITYFKGENSWAIKYEDTDNRDMKIIDYGESFVDKDVKNPCLEFQYEITVAVVSVFNVMWSKVIDKEGKGELFSQLINLLKNCKTSILDVLIQAEIYNDLKFHDSHSYKVNIFPTPQ